MDYKKFIEDIQKLEHPRLEALRSARIEDATTTTLEQSALLKALVDLGPVTGWITWPDQLESIEQPSAINTDQPLPPLEGELVTQDKHSVRFHYTGQAWMLVRQPLPILTEAAQANALIETIELANKHSKQPNLQYIRIWQHSQEQGFITTDAIFQGFTGGKQ